MTAQPESLRMRMAAVALIGGLGLVYTLASRGGDERTLAQRDVAGNAAAAQPAPVNAPQKYYAEANFCSSCHSRAEDYKKVSDRLLCRMLEFPIWDGQDKHKIAAKVLSEPRAREMGERLGIKVAESASCTNCHGSLAGVTEPQPFRQEENGVSCVACHGPFRDWILGHQLPNDPRWRKNTRRQKEELFGMTDLWDPVTRAAKCASCHIGSAGEGKVVTHAMYAAGHPPLPGLETATFSDVQPRHWQYLREKPTVAQKEQGYNPGKHEQTELVVASGLVALRDTMRLYAAEARADGLVKEPESHWPDFARFDCYACHHDLQVPSWRQARGYAGRAPGRPGTPAWPDVLVQLGITVADPDGSKGRLSEFKQAAGAFQGALGNRPFGDRERSIAAAEALAAWADAVCKDLQGIVEDPQRVGVQSPVVLRLLHQLCQIAASGPVDYDSARQIALAFQIIYRETRAIDPQALPDPSLDSLVGDLIDKSHLNFPGAGSQSMIENTLKNRLSAVFDFDPGAFQARFAEIARHLPPL